MSDILTDNQQEKRSEIDELLADVANKYPGSEQRNTEYSLPLDDNQRAGDLEAAASEQLDGSTAIYGAFELKLAEQIENLKFEHKTIGGLDPRDVSDKLKQMLTEIRRLSREMYEQIKEYKTAETPLAKQSYAEDKSEEMVKDMSTDYHSLLREARLEAKNILAEAERKADEEMLQARARLRQELDQTAADIEARKQEIGELTIERDRLITLNSDLEKIYHNYHQEIAIVLEKVTK